MKFRGNRVDGFFTISYIEEPGTDLTTQIEYKLSQLNADLEDVQYSTHITQDNKVVHDILVMYVIKDN